MLPSDSLPSSSAAAGQPAFTHALFRRFIAERKATLHLVDAVFQHRSDDVEAVCTQLQGLSTLAFKRVQQHVKLHPDSWLAPAMARYTEKVEAKTVEVKVAGFEPMVAAFTRQVDALTTAQLDKIIATARARLEPYRSMCQQRIELVYDCSGSMWGARDKSAPIVVGFYICMMLVEVLGLDHITTSASFAHNVRLDQATRAQRHEALFMAYEAEARNGGGNNWEAVYACLRPRWEGKTVVVLTDGDCDPNTCMGAHPFKQLFDETESTQVVVWNLNQAELTLQHTDFKATQPRLAYVSGNAVHLIEPVLEALLQPGQALSPELILRTALDKPEFRFPTPLVCTGQWGGAAGTAALVRSVADNMPKQTSKGKQAQVCPAGRRGGRGGRGRAVAPRGGHVGAAPVPGAAMTEEEDDDEEDDVGW